MKESKQGLADEQLDALLCELGVAPSASSEQTKQESSIELLIEEIFELKPPSIPPASPALPKLPLDGEKKKKRSNSLIWITAALLIGLFAGCGFGFFWAKSEGVLDKPLVEPNEEIPTQISYWIQELTSLYEKLNPPADEKNEIIEPIDPPDEMETLAPSEPT